jgi:Plasmid recombination enzyme
MTDATPNFCGLRIEKHKTLEHIAASLKHQLREGKTPNADPTRTKNNKYLGGKNSLEILEKVEAAIAQTKKLRTGGNLCLEFVMYTSFGVGNNDNNAKKSNLITENDAYFAEARKFLQKKFGKQNVICQQNHYDEKTAHASFFVLPRWANKKRGNKYEFNSKKFTGGKKYVLSTWQTEFYENVGKKFDLVRGIQGSKVRHTTQQDHQKFLEMQVVDLPPPLDFINPLTCQSALEKVQSIAAQGHEAMFKNESFRKERELLIKDSQRERMKRLEAEDKLENDKKESKVELEKQENNRKRLVKLTALLIKQTYSKSDLAKQFGVAILGKEDIFDALVQQKKAANFYDAVELVSNKLAPKSGDSWISKAVWLDEYTKDEQIDPRASKPV